MDLENLLKTNEEVNEIFFSICRSYYLRTDEQKGYIEIRSTEKEVEQYINHINGDSAQTTIKLKYVKNDELNYDTQSSFMIKLNDNLTPINLIRKRMILFNRTTLPDECIHFLKCLTCEGTNCYKDLINFPFTKATCDCCNEQKDIRRIVECIKCCTQYVYV